MLARMKKNIPLAILLGGFYGSVRLKREIAFLNIDMSAPTFRIYKNSWYARNREEYLESMREEYIKNRDAIVAKRRERHVCALCGGRYTTDHRATHMRSKKHQQAVAETEQRILNLTLLLTSSKPVPLGRH